MNFFSLILFFKIIATFRVVIILLAITLSSTVLAADYPPNIDYGQQGDFIAKRAVENGRAAIIMPIGPVVITQPEGPGTSSAGLDNGVDSVNAYWDLTDLTNPQSFEMTHCATHQAGCSNTSPIQAHATVIRLIDGEPLLWEPTWRTGRYTGFDPNGASSAEQMTKIPYNNAFRKKHGTIGRYGSLTSPYNHSIYWGYGDPPTEDYYIRDSRTADGTDASGGGNFLGYPLVEWDHFGLTGVSGFPIWMGNLLIYASDQLQKGIAIYDTTGYKDGNTPQLLSVFNPTVNKPEPNNGKKERIGGYWFEPYGNDRIVFAARRVSNPVQREFSSMFIVNYADPSNPFVSCEVYFDQDSTTREDGDITSNPQYVHFQDGYAFVDHFRVDIAACEAAYANDQRVVQSDDPTVDEFYDVVYRYQDIDHSCDGSQYYRPLGQVGIFGGYNQSETKWTIDYAGSPLPANNEAVRVYRNGELIVSTGSAYGYRTNEDGTHKVLAFSRAALAGDQINTVSSPELRTVLFAGTDEHMNEQGLCFVVMHDEPDTKAPYISGHAPVDGASNVPVDTFIHIHIPETLRSETLKGAMVVRNATTNEVISSRQQLSHTGMLSIWPDEDLDIDTTYTVSISGIKDYMGNTMTPYSFSFSTGENTTSPPPPPPNDDTAPTFSGTPYYANQSSQLACSAESTTNNLWAVNPDNDSVSIINTAHDSSYILSAQVTQNISNGYKHPSSVTRLNEHYAVTYRDSDVVVIYDASGMQQRVINTGYGTQPISSVADDDYLYVALYRKGMKLNNQSVPFMEEYGEVIKIRRQDYQLVARADLGPTPKGMALRDNRLLITRFISPSTHAEVYDLNTTDLSLTRTLKINKVTVSDDLDHGTGIANFLNSITFSPDGTRAYIAAVKQNVNNPDIDDDNAVRPMAAIIDLENNRDLNQSPGTREGTIDYDNAADPQFFSYLVNGHQAVAFQGNNRVQVLNTVDNTQAAFVTGFAPQATCSTLRTLYVKNFTDRSVSAIDVAEWMHDGELNPNIVNIQLINPVDDKLNSDELAGLKLFYHSEQDTFGIEGYISCASCHMGGGQDGQVWDMTSLGEGPRNTLSLNGQSGTRFGNLHWTSNFDEVQDFIFQIIKLNKGTADVDNGINSFDVNRDPLLVNTTGLSTKIDQLSAYVASLGKETLERSVLKQGKQASAARGEQLFYDRNCASCHAPPAFTDGERHDVGTGMSVRTPRLTELFNSAPYLHDGRAQELSNVLSTGTTHHRHTSALSSQQLNDLITYLLSLDQGNLIEDNITFTGQPSWQGQFGHLIELPDDDQWQVCADEREICTVPQGSTIRYGANGVYHYLHNQSGDVNCHNFVFGDAVHGVSKTCEYFAPMSETADDGFCFPIKAKNGGMVLICL